eukprot:scaffold224601_cov19-Tisochrysis_lutea.AAC.2
MLADAFFLKTSHCWRGLKLIHGPDSESHECISGACMCATQTPEYISGSCRPRPNRESGTEACS